MSALVPYSSHGFANPHHFRAHRRKGNNYNNQYFMGQHPSIPRPFPTLPYYQSYPFQLDQRSLGNYRLLEQAQMNANWANLRQVETQYRYAQYIRQLDELQKRRIRPEAAPPAGALETTAGGWYRTTNTWYQYEKEIRYIPYPVFLGGNNFGFNVSRNLPYEYRTTLGFGSVVNSPLQPGNANWNLPPKIRVIFIPTDPTPIQPFYTNALAMPPFLYNRMTQPLCALPLPPPLPNVASLPLTPVVQQMVAQQYANPVATLPFMPNWQMPQAIGPAYPPYMQPQQQFYPSVPALQSSQYISPSYLPPALLPGNMPLLPSNTPSFPYSTDASRLQLPWSNNTYPNTCRACIPAPPTLNLAVTGHFWSQHCSACHHVPADATNPNSRPANGRFTPLLRHPTVQQYTASAPMQLQQHQPPRYYPHINAPDSSRPWVHPLPRLPPGAVLISDEYLPMRNVPQALQFTQTHPKNHPRVYKSLSKSTAPSMGAYTHERQRKKKSKRKKQREIEEERSQVLYTSNSASSILSSSTSTKTHRSSSSSRCSLCEAVRAHETSKSITSPTDMPEDVAQKELTPAAQNVKLQYTFQPLDLPSVYRNKLRSKSSDTDTVSISSSSMSTDSFLINPDDVENQQRSIIQIDVIKEVKEEEENEENESVPLSSSPIVSTVRRSRRAVYVIQRYSSTSPSITSLTSSNQSTSLEEGESDVVSTTSTIKVFEEMKENSKSAHI